MVNISIPVSLDCDIKEGLSTLCFVLPYNSVDCVDLIGQMISFPLQELFSTRMQEYICLAFFSTVHVVWNDIYK